MAVFVSVLETVPQFVAPQPVPLIVQVTEEFVAKQTVAVNDSCCPSATVDAEGETLMAGEQLAEIVIEAEADWLESALLVEINSTGFVGGIDAGAV